MQDSAQTYGQGTYSHPAYDSLDVIICVTRVYPGDVLGRITRADPVENHRETDVVAVLEAWEEATLGKHCEHNSGSIEYLLIE